MKVLYKEFYFEALQTNNVLKKKYFLQPTIQPCLF